MLAKEDDGGALAAGARGAAGAVQVRLCVLRHIPVHDEVDVMNVQAARRHVRGHQHVRLALQRV